MASWSDRILAALLPLVTYITWLLASYFALLVPVLLYCLFIAASRSFVADHTLRYIDALITAFMFKLGLLGVVFAVRMLDQRYEPYISFINSIEFVTIGSLVLQSYIFLASILFILFPLLGGPFRMPLSLRVFITIKKLNNCKSFDSPNQF